MITELISNKLTGSIITNYNSIQSLVSRYLSLSDVQTMESRSLSHKNEQRSSTQNNPKSERIDHLKNSFDSRNLQGSFNSNIKFSFAKVQPKLEVSQPSDPYEQEADRVAEQIMNMSTHSKINSSLSITADHEDKANRQCSSCEMKEKKLKEDEKEVKISRKVSIGTKNGHNLNELSIDTSSLHDGGVPLDISTKEYMESRFGYNFNNVRIHSDEYANRSARSINALAYTIGNEIVFGAGRYRPYTSEGKILLAHELTHVVQQTAKKNGGREQYQSPNKYRIVNNAEVSRIYRFSTQDCEPSDVPSIIAPADLRATQMAIHATALLARFLSTPSDPHVRDLLLKNFNDDKLSTIRAVYLNFKKIEAELLGGDYQYECEDDCDKENAYVYAFWTDVHLCMNKLKGNPIDFIAGVIIHEMSHYAADTDDNEYFYPGSGVTTLSEDDAIENADSYEGFAARL